MKNIAVTEDDKLFGWRADHPRLYYNDVAFAPKLDISVKAVVLPLSTRQGIDTVLFVITGVPLVLRLIAGAFLGCNNGRRLPFQDGVFPLNVFKSWL